MRALIVVAVQLISSTAVFADDLADELHAAAKAGDAKRVEALLAKEVDVNAKTAYGATALHFAADKGHAEVARVLIAHKANDATLSHWDRASGDSESLTMNMLS